MAPRSRSDTPTLARVVATCSFTLASVFVRFVADVNAMDDSSLDVRNFSRCIKHQTYKTSPNEILQRTITAVASAQNFITGHQRSEKRIFRACDWPNFKCILLRRSIPRLHYLRRRRDLVSIAAARTEFSRTLFLLSQVQWHQPKLAH